MGQFGLFCDFCESKSGSCGQVNALLMVRYFLWLVVYLSLIVFTHNIVLSTGVFTSLTGVYHKEGFIGLYKGNYVQMVRVFPYAAIQFMSYEQYRGVSLCYWIGQIASVRLE